MFNNDFVYTTPGLVIFIIVIIVLFILAMWDIGRSIIDICEATEFNIKKYPLHKEWLKTLLQGIAILVVGIIGIISYASKSKRTKVVYTYPEYNLEAIYEDIQSNKIYTDYYKIKYIDNVEEKEKIVILEDRINDGEITAIYYKFEDRYNLDAYRNKEN